MQHSPSTDYMMVFHASSRKTDGFVHPSVSPALQEGELFYIPVFHKKK